MFCKYCGTEISDDSVFCAKCGKKIYEEAPIASNEKCDDCNPIRIQLLDKEKITWKDTANLQWKKPIAARLIQPFLLIVGLFFLCYGIVWSCIIEEKAMEFGQYSYHPYYYPNFDQFCASAEEPLGIIEVYVDLAKDDPNYPFYKEEWNSLYYKQYVDKKYYKEWGIDTATLTFYHSPYGDQLTSDQFFKMSRIENEKLLSFIPYDYMKYYYMTVQLAVSKFRTRALLIFILPALILIILSIIWIIKTTHISDKKAILPRDYADKIEDYSWYGFTLHKYVRFIKNDKYGLLDAANRSITVPATFELIEWREKNKSFDGVVDGVRKTYNID